MRYNILKNFSPSIFILSLIMACALWYTVTVRNTVDIQVEVRIDYKNIPKDLIIVDGLIKEINVRLSGPEALVNKFNPSSLVHVMDLSSIQKGENIIPFNNPSWQKAFRAYNIHDIQPPNLTIVADTFQERNVAIAPNMLTTLHSSAFVVKDVVISPNNALVSGPESVVKKMKNIPLPIRIDPKTEPGTYTEKLPLPLLEANISVIPTSVEVSYTVASERKSLELSRLIRIEAQEKLNYTVEPKEVNLTVELPQALLKNSSYLAQAYVSVTPPLLEVGQEAQVPLRIILANGMTIVKAPPENVTVTRIR